MEALRRWQEVVTDLPVAGLPLVGAGGEPVDFARTIVSHGVAELPPNRLDLEGRMLETTLPVPRGARTVRLTQGGDALHIESIAGSIGTRVGDAVAKTVAHMFRLDEDLSGFYTLVGAKGELSWCARGAGRMLRAPTVFEDVVKTKRTLIRTSARTGEPYAQARVTGASASAHPRARARKAPVAAPPSARSLGGGRSAQC